MGDIPSGLPHPDGSLRIQNAAHALAAARNEVMRAHSRLDEFLARGVVPGDLEPDARLALPSHAAICGGRTRAVYLTGMASFTDRRSSCPPH